MPKQPFPEIAELAQWVRAAEDLDEALRILASALDGAGFGPVHCSLVMIEPGGMFRIAGMWSAVPSRLDPGWIINAMVTEDSQHYAERLLAGQPVRILLPHDDLGVLGDIVRHEGVQAILVAPISGPSGIVAVMSMSSADVAAVQRIDLSRFRELGQAIGDVLLSKVPPVIEAG